MSMHQETEEANSGKLVDIKWTVRPMRKDDINECLEIWSKVELVEAYNTVSAGLAADPEGFYVAELKDSG